MNKLKYANATQLLQILIAVIFLPALFIAYVSGFWLDFKTSYGPLDVQYAEYRLLREFSGGYKSPPYVVFIDLNAMKEVRTPPGSWLRNLDRDAVLKVGFIERLYRSEVMPAIVFVEQNNEVLYSLRQGLGVLNKKVKTNTNILFILVSISVLLIPIYTHFKNKS